MALHVIHDVGNYYSATAPLNQLEVDRLDIARQNNVIWKTYKSLHALHTSSVCRQFPVVTKLHDPTSNKDLTFVPRLNRTMFAVHNLGNRCHKYCLNYLIG